MIKIIKNESDYDAALAEFERLLDLNLSADAPERNQFEVLGLLIENYENRVHAISLPDPIDAIEVIMEAKGLTRRDLVPFIGNASKVSEVLSRKRPLTLPMVRALNEGLGIPAKVLITDTTEADENNNFDFEKFPFKELCKLGWLSGKDATVKAWRTKAHEIVSDFLAPIGGMEAAPILRREGFRLREAKKMDPVNLTVWHAEAARRAEAQNAPPFIPETLNADFFSKLAKLSIEEDGPLKAVAFLKEIGICVVILPHLRQTYLDGAAFKLKSGTPVIGLTLRHDRIDNFWFVLMHELAHVTCHLSEGFEIILDDLDTDTIGDDKFKAIEDEADKIALNSLIPRENWDRSEAKDIPSVYAINELAKEVGIHPAIVAGRVCHESGQYKKFGRHLGHGDVRKQFISNEA